MARSILIIILFLFSVSMVLATFAESTWVLWSVKETKIFDSEKGSHAAWAYVDAFTNKQACLEGKNREQEEGVRLQCVPVEIDPNHTIFR